MIAVKTVVDGAGYCCCCNVLCRQCPAAVDEIAEEAISGGGVVVITTGMVSGNDVTRHGMSSQDNIWHCGALPLR